MDSERVSLVAFVLAIAFLSLGYGMYSAHRSTFPYKQLSNFEPLKEAIYLLKGGGRDPWYYSDRDVEAQTVIHDASAMASGLRVVSGLTADGEFLVRIIEPDGTEVNRWLFDIFSIGTDFAHLDPKDRPRSRPGAHVHGVLPLDDGGMVFVIESMGLLRMDACGNITWMVEDAIHHSIYQGNAGNFWSSAESRKEEWAGMPAAHTPPVLEMRVVKISPGGDILANLPVFDLLQKNGLEGLLYLSSIANENPTFSGDTLHMNDVEVFPDDMEPGVFQPGDVMISLRNINGVFVFDPSDWSLRAHVVGAFVRQHDPDFIDGNRVSIFDNNPLADDNGVKSSRIVIWDARDDSVEVEWTGTEDQPFFTSIMGKHQRLENGNLLLVESVNGRVIEVAPDGRIVWEWNNVIDEGRVGLIDDAQRLPPEFDGAFYRDAIAGCST